MKGKKVLSWILILASIVSFNLGETVIYASTNSQEEKKSKDIISELQTDDTEEKLEPKIIRELEDRRTANTKEFLKEDMTIEAVTYDEDIHYKDGDKWVEIDNSLDTLSKEGERKSERSLIDSFVGFFKDDEDEEEYINTDNELQVKLSKKSKEEGLGNLKIDNYEIT